MHYFDGVGIIGWEFYFQVPQPVQQLVLVLLRVHQQHQPLPVQQQRHQQVPVQQQRYKLCQTVTHIIVH